MKETKNSKSSRKIAILLAIILCFGTLLSVDIPETAIAADAAYFDASECNTIGVYRQSHTIPSGTLFYGIYLMSLSSLSDTLMERAAESAIASGQDSMYYKSELAGGQWYKIDSASGISGITAGGELVSEESLDKLYLKYYVEPNGTVKDCKITRQLVVSHYQTAYAWADRSCSWCNFWYGPIRVKVTYPVFKWVETTDVTTSVYNYPEPYNKYFMEEFEPLRAVLGTYLTAENQNNKGGHYNYTEITHFMDIWPTDAITEMDDLILNNIAYAQSQLYGSNSEIESEMADILYIMGDSIDAHRRVQYLENIINVPFITDKGFYTISGQSFWQDVLRIAGVNSKKTEEEQKKKNQFPMKRYEVPGTWCYWGGMSFLEKYVICDADAVLTEAIGETASNISDSINNYSTKIITDPGEDETSTEIAKDKYSLYTSISAVIARDPTQKTNGKYNWYDDLYKYLNLYHIEQGTIARKNDELALLGDSNGYANNDGLLINRVTNKYRNRIWAGAQSHYYEIQQQGANEQVLKNELNDEAEILEAYRAELQFVIKAKLNRMPAKDRRAYLDNRLNYTQAMFNSFKAEKANDPLYANAVLSIQKHIKWLSAELQLALADDGDTTRLEQLIVEKKKLQEEYLEALDENDLSEAEIIESAIEDIDDQIQEEIDSYSDVNGESNENKAVESNVGTLGGLIEKLSKKVIDDIDDGKTESEALTALVMIGADDKLNELKDIFAGNDTFAEAYKNAEDEFKDSGLVKETSSLTTTSKKGSTGSGGAGGSPDGNGADQNATSNDNENGGSQSTSRGDGSQGSSGSDADNLGKTRITDGLNGDGKSKNTKDVADKTGDKKTDKLLSELDGVRGTKGLTSSEIEAIIETSLGSKSSKLSADGKIIAAVATGVVGDAGYSDARNLSKSIMSKCVQENNKYAYKTYKDSNGKAYVSLRTIDKISDFRYDFKMADYTMENVGAGQIYHYSLSSQEVSLSASTKVKMDALPVKYNDVVYVISSEANLHYDVTAEPVSETDYSGALTSSMEDKKNDLIEALIEAIKEKNQ